MKPGKCLLVGGRHFRDDVSHHHHGGIDQQADGNGKAAQAHQVGGKTSQFHRDERRKRRQGQDQGYRQGRAKIAKEQPQQNQHQDNCLDQRFGHGGNGPVDQVAAVIKHAD